MPRKVLDPQKKVHRKLWNKEDMAKAIKAVQDNVIGLKKASKIFCVPRATLQRLSRLKKLPEEAACTKLGRKPIIPEALEEELVQYLLIMERKFYGLTRQDVRQLAYQLCERNGLKHPFSDGLAGRAWFDHFMNRHKNVLSVLKPAATSFSRANGFNKDAVNHFFDILETEYEKHTYPPDRVFNVDETGVSVVQSKIPRVVGLKGKRQIGALSSAERGSLVTVVCSMSAGGTFVPPLLIFPRKNMTETLMKGSPPGSIGKCHPSGWIQANLFTDWFKHFIQKTKPTENDPILLILDGHNTHTKNIDVVDLARENHISIVSLPPHTTHKLQPLDKSFMGPLKHHYSENIRLWMRHNNRPVGPYDIAELFGKAYLTCQSGAIAVNGFGVTGIFPCNRKIFSEVEFATDTTEAENTAVLQTSKGRSKMINVKSSTDMVLNFHDAGICSTSVGSNQTSTLTSTNSVLLNREPRSSSLETPTRCVTNSHSILHQPCARDLEEAGPSSVCSFTNKNKSTGNVVSPKDIWPIPKPKRKINNKGPKPAKAALITSSPYRIALLEAGNKCSNVGKEKKDFKQVKNLTTAIKSKGIKNKPSMKSCKRKLVLSTEESEKESTYSDIDSGESVLDTPFGVTKPDQDDAACLFCESLFSNDSKGELWVKCMICEMWAHNECAGCEKDYYVCDFCK